MTIIQNKYNEITPGDKKFKRCIAGIGSEATLAALITNKEKNVKMEFISYHMLPDVAVLDPRMTATLPSKMTASTAFDSLVHAVEANTCIQKNPMSDA